MSNPDQKPEYLEAPGIMLVKALRENGYRIADDYTKHEVSEAPSDWHFGVLHPRPPIPMTLFGLKWQRNQRPLYIAEVTIGHKSFFSGGWNPFHQSPTDDWVLNIYGRDHAEPLIALFKRVLETNRYRLPEGIAVVAGLKRETPMIEGDPCS